MCIYHVFQWIVICKTNDNIEVESGFQFRLYNKLHLKFIMYVCYKDHLTQYIIKHLNT